MSLLDYKDLKTELGLGSLDIEDDDFLESLCSRVQSTFEGLTNRKYEEAQVTEYYGCGKLVSTLFLKNYPVLEISSIHDDPDWEWGSDTLLDSDDYSFDSNTGMVFYNGYFSKGQRSVKITYRYGYVASVPDPVPSYGYNLLPDELKHIWLRQAVVWYRDMKNSDHGVVSKADSVTGSTITKVSLVDGMLPEFKDLADRYRRI